MKSLSFGQLFGIKLELHWSFVLIGLMVASLLFFTQPANFLPMLMVFFFLFFSVFLHELTHGVVSIQRGIQVEKIVLLPIGGVAMTESLPDKAKDEFLIAIAGPAFNFLVVICILLLVSLFPLPFPRSTFPSFLSLFTSSDLVIPPLLSMPLFTVLWVNLILGSFNLFLPALPLDGGRVFRSLLSFKLGYLKATRIITRISSFVGLAMVFFGFIASHLILMVIGLFVFFGSREEEKLVIMKETLKRSKLSALINRRPLLLKGSLSVDEAFDRILFRKKSPALVQIREGKYAVLSIEDLPQLAEKKDSALSAVLKEVKPVQIGASPGIALERMLSTGHRLLPVLKGKKLAGAIEGKTLENAYRTAKARSLLGK